MKYANVLGAINNVPFQIGEIITFSPVGKYVEGVFISCPDDINLGDYFYNGNFIKAPVGDIKYYKVDNNEFILNIETKPSLILANADKLKLKRDSAFLAGIVYSNITFSITDKVKQDYTTLMVMKDVLIYPYKIYGENGYITLPSSSDLAIFLGVIFNWCSAIEIKCAEDISDLPNKTMEQLIGELNA